MPEPIPHDILWNAAEACMTATIEGARAMGGVNPWPPDLLGTPLQPPCLEPFSRFEIEEASAFLVRLGFFEHPKRPKATKLKGGTE